jgi:hypothetical protein
MQRPMNPINGLDAPPGGVGAAIHVQTKGAIEPPVRRKIARPSTHSPVFKRAAMKSSG